MRYNLTLTDTTGATPDITLTGNDAAALTARLARRLTGKRQHRRPKGSGGIRRTDKGVMAYRTVIDPKTGDRHVVSAIARNQTLAQTKLEDKLKTVLAVGFTKTPTIKEWTERWFEDICPSSLKPTTRQSYRTLADMDIIPSVGNVRLDELKPAHLRDMERYITVTRGNAPSRALTSWRFLHKLMNDAVVEGIIDRNPVISGTAPRVTAKERKVMTPEQAAAFINAEPSDMWRLMWRFAFTTGMRQAERLGLTVGELDLESDSPTVRVDWQLKSITPEGLKHLSRDAEHIHLCGSRYLIRPKTAKSRRIIPLPPELAAELRMFIAVHGTGVGGLVFHRNGKPIAYQLEARLWKANLERIGLEDITPHSARHTAATIMNRLGLDDVTRTAIMGHASITLTNEVYTHAEFARLAVATKGVERALDGGR